MNPMPALYKRLSAIGATKEYVTEIILPEWWEDEIAETPAGYEEALGIISRNLNLDPASLRNPDSLIKRKRE